MVVHWLVKRPRFSLATTCALWRKLAGNATNLPSGQSGAIGIRPFTGQNWDMQASRLLILLLLAAAALVDLVMLSAVGSVAGGFFRWPHPLLAVLFSLAFSQVSVAAIWAGLSDSSLPWRLAGMVSVVTVWSVALAWEAADAVGGYGKDVWCMHLLVHALFILAILLTVRARGGRLTNCLKTNSKPQQRRWQFSLAYLFAWLTATSVSLGLLRYTIDFDLSISNRYWHEILGIGFCNAVVSLATIWAGLSGKRLMLRMAVLCPAAGGVLSLPLVLNSARGDIRLSWAVLWILQMVWLSAWLFVLRTAGIRFVWRDRGR